MEVKPIAIISTDWHLKPDNCDLITNLLQDELELAKKIGVSTHIWLGDIFDSRISQKECVLNTFGNILDSYHNNKQTMIAIPGNHDKTDYTSKNSFLDPYKHYPSFSLIRSAEVLSIKNIAMLFIPFFAEKEWIEEFEKVNKKANILFTHMAFSGSRNNDGTEVESKLTPSMLKKYKYVYGGHYHDPQQITSSIFHLGSLCQNNFGEDDKKGFYVLYEDCSVELVKSERSSFRKIVVDLDTMSPDEIEERIVLFHASKKNDDDRIRIEVTGTQDKVSAFDKSKYSSMGIDVKPKIKEIEEVIDAEEKVTEIKVLTKTDIMERFALFCKDKKYNADEASDILQKALGD